MDERHTVVVGIDGSAGSGTALWFALEDAARRVTGVRVVSVLTTSQYWPSDYAPSVLPTVGDLEDDLRVIARRTVDDVVAERPDLAAVPVELRVIEGWPATVLIGQSRGADLLVIGHRGRGGFAGAVLGSVGLQCVLHAECPVAVVRPVPRSGRGGEDAGPTGHRGLHAGRGTPVLGAFY